MQICESMLFMYTFLIIYKFRKENMMNELKKVGVDFKIAENVKIMEPELVSIGDNVEFYYGVYVQPCGKEITIGSNTHFAPYAVLYGPLEVGENCAIAAHVVLASVAHTHEKVDVPFVKQPVDQRKITIEDNVWIGANAVITPGITIGTGSIIGAGAVVVTGIPAKVFEKVAA